MICKNIRCRYSTPDNICEKDEIYIDECGRCGCYEKGFLYYFYAFTKVMQNSNFICLQDLTPDIRYSIYYLMKCLPISFAVDEIRGILLMKNTETDEILNRDRIFEMIQNDIDDEALEDCIQEFETKGLPKTQNESGEEVSVEEAQKEYNENHQDKPYGWLSPTGTFHKVPFGEHEKFANEYIRSHGWNEDFREWQKQEYEKESYAAIARDYLTKTKGFVLIDSPSGIGYYVVNGKPMTKQQEEFLYNYFTDMGMKNRAEMYLNED